MPLTPSHAAAALLLRRIDSRLPFSALVVGTLTPDFEYILRLAPRGTFAHSLPGVLLFCLTVSLLTWVIYDRNVRPAVADLLPRELATEVQEPQPVSILTVLTALFIGALSHVLWDAFTHRTGFFVEHLAPLQAVVLPAADLRLYSVLQHGSTVVGALVLLLAAIHGIRRRQAEGRQHAPAEAARAIRVLFLLILAAAVAAALNGARALDNGFAPALGYAAVGAMAGFALALLGYSLSVRRPAA